MTLALWLPTTHRSRYKHPHLDCPIHQDRDSSSQSMMAASPPSSAVLAATDTARKYYDSSDADTFYSTIWGGSDIHIGLYTSPTDSIATASQRTVSHMASLLAPITASTHMLDMGAGYGGAARYLAKTYGCRVTCLNLSEVENRRNREMTRKAGLEGLVEVVEGSFEHVPCESSIFDVVWSQDAFLHSGNRKAVVREICRVVKGDGQVIFTDPMGAGPPNSSTHSKVLAPILQRLNLESLGDYCAYREAFAEAGVPGLIFEDLTEQMVMHYSRVLEELESREGQLKGKVSDEYVENMKVGLEHWIEGGKSGLLQWGVMQLHKKSRENHE